MSGRDGLALPAAGIDDAEAGLRGAFAASMRAFHEALDGPPADAETVAEAASLVVEALQQGASHVDLGRLGEVERERFALALSRSPVVAGPADGARPLVWSGNALYLARYWRYERDLAQRLSHFNRVREGLDPVRVSAALQALFPAPAAGGVDWQAVAAATAVLRQLCIISGGPGTGKTSTVARILALLVVLEPDTRIALAAPTGKAAARVQESLREQLDRLELPADARSRLPQVSFTVHRLLGARPGTSESMFGPQRRLAFDVVVVDEASMLDLALASKLLSALPDHARLVLLGDKDQLSSVEAGAVYAEMSAVRHVSAAWAARVGGLTRSILPASLPDAAHPLRDAVVWFEHSYRVAEASPLRQLALAVNANDTPSILRLRDAGSREIESLDRLPEPEALAERLVERFGPFIQALQAGEPDTAVLAAFNGFRVLCAARQGRYGAENLDRLLVEALRRRLGLGSGRETWFAGRPVMVTQNDHAFRLYNGDTGIALAKPDGSLSVRFPLPDGGMRGIAPARLPGPAGAMAITVHRAQGSEFDAVALVADAGNARMLSRALFYTAITRARSSLLLCVAPEAFNADALGAAEIRTALWAQE